MNKKSYLFVLSLLLLSFFSLSFASAWTLNGTVSDVNGNALNNTNVSVAVYAMGMGGPTIQFYNSTTSSSSGVFSLEVTDNSSYMYGITFIHRNATTNAVDYVGQSLPSFPYPVVAGGLSSNFYLQNADRKSVV